MEDFTFNKYPKSITKAIRYIKQDGSLEQLKELRGLLESSIYQRMLTLEEISKNKGFMKG
ncbi:hypothetical protein [Metabacillus arenae]|uniref:Uncharacterized protein n=1 Tax=Metabacillus arenae TaxID=2771434 RepID=A0A926N8X5_9BACI|nr:hypothetical protein [Metabacillus arenae]MBD1378869.1 hypothetical protein [Metabacillus arenae]